MRQRLAAIGRVISAVMVTRYLAIRMLKPVIAIGTAGVFAGAPISAFAVQLSVTDSCGHTLSATGGSTSVDQNGNLTISGVTGNYVTLFGCATQPPTVPACSLSASATSIAPGGSTTLYSNCSSSPTSYTWTSPSDTPSVPSGSTFTATFPNPGAYTYSVFASNGSGPGIASNQLTILVGDSTSKPTCTLTASPVILIQGNKSRLQSVCNPTPTSYSWIWDGGAPTPSGASGEYTFTTAGTYTYKVKGTNAQGAGPTASATVTVLTGVTAALSFSPSQMPIGANSTLGLTLSNGNSIAAAGVGFSLTHNSAIHNASPANATSTCGGTLTAADGGSTVALSGGTVPASGSCTIQVTVTSSTAGNFGDGTGVITTSNMGTTPSATASLLVLNPPTPSVAFNPTSVATNATSTLTLTASNSNSYAITGAAITATYPAGLVNAATPSATSSCGGTIAAAAGGTSLSVTGISISGTRSCTLSASVTSAAAGSYAVTLPAGSITSTNAGSNTTSASATLTVGP